MSTPVAARPRPRSRRQVRGAIGIVAAAALVAVMAYDTKAVKIGAGDTAAPGAFVPAQYGQATFPKVQSAVDGKAVDAATLANAISQDPGAAAKRYGVPAGEATEYSVRLAGTVGKDDLGVYDVQVPGLPDGFKVQVQTGPAINGTDLRDATGTIEFGQFTNQIDYQNAGSAINKEMKKQVLSKVDAANLTGKTVNVVGAFRAGPDPKAWLVTPVKLDVR